MRIGIKVTNNSKEVKAAMKKANQNALEAVGKAAEGYVKMNAPVKTGALRNSISYKADGKSVMVGSTLMSEDYPIYLEKGTDKQPAQPYISPGVMNNLSALKKIAEMQYKNSMN